MIFDDDIRTADAATLQKIAVQQGRINEANCERYRTAELEHFRAMRELSALGVQVQQNLLAANNMEMWVRLYEVHLQARKTALSASTTDSTRDDIAKDSAAMTNIAYAAMINGMHPAEAMEV